MSPSPSPVEHTVASALLLLSEKPVFPTNGESNSEGSDIKSCDDESLSLVSSGSKSCPSALSIEGSSQETGDHCLRLDSVSARCQLMKIEMVRRKRSQVCWSPVNLKLTEVKPGPESSVSDESKELSCLSSGSSEVSSAQNLFKVTLQPQRNTFVSEEQKKKRGYSSTPICRRAEAILSLLSRSSSSEVKIRQILGDSPDTSKALRMLLKMEEIKRSGSGGRQDPYIYTIA